MEKDQGKAEVMKISETGNPKNAGRKGYKRLLKENEGYILDLISNGFLNKEVAQSLGVTEQTFYNYLKKNPQFAEQVHKSKIRADNNVVAALYKRAVGYEYEETHREFEPSDKAAGRDKAEPVLKSLKIVKKHSAPNVMAALAWLFNRRKELWKNKQVDMKDNIPKIPEFEELTDADLQKELIRLIKSTKTETDTSSEAVV